MCGRQIGDRRLPGRAGPVVVVRAPPQGEGRAVGVQAAAASVIGGAAAEGRRHGRCPVVAAGWGRRHGCGYRRRLIQCEAHSRACEGIACFVGRLRLHSVGAVGRGRPRRQRDVVGPCRRGVTARRAAGGGQIRNTGLPGRSVPVKIVRAPLQREGRAVGVQADAAIVVGRAARECGRHSSAAVAASVHRCGD